MYAQRESLNENKSRAIANLVAQKKNIGNQGLEFLDERPEATAQRKLQSMIRGPAIQQSSYLREGIDNNGHDQQRGKWPSDTTQLLDTEKHHTPDEPVQLRNKIFRGDNKSLNINSNSNGYTKRSNQEVMQQVAVTLPNPDKANLNTWDLDTNGESRVYLKGWIDEAVSYSNIAALTQLRAAMLTIGQPSLFEMVHLDYATKAIIDVNQYLAGLPNLLAVNHQQLMNVGNGVLTLIQQRDALNAMLPNRVDGTLITNYLQGPDSYTVATIANGKQQGALGHHIFIEFSDGSISEYAWPETKATYPKSQIDHRIATRAQVARVKMAAYKHGAGGKPSRYYMDTEQMIPRFQGMVYFPWYQDCFDWVDAVLGEAGEPKATLVRLTPGAVFKWGGVLVLLAGVGMWAKTMLSDK